MTILRGYVEWLCGLQFECIPKPAAVAARNAVFDTVAAILSGKSGKSGTDQFLVF